MSITKRFCEKSFESINRYIDQEQPLLGKQHRSYACAFLLTTEYNNSLNVVDAVLRQNGMDDRERKANIANYLIHNDKDFHELIQKAGVHAGIDTSKLLNAISNPSLEQPRL